MNLLHPGLALLVTMISCGFAAAMIAEMINLLLRRRRLERCATAARKREIALLRELMTVAAGSGSIEDAPAFMAADPELRLNAITHVLQMVRGADRDAMLNLAEQAHVLDTAITNLERKAMSRRIDALRILEQIPVNASIKGIRARMGNDPSPAVRIEAAAALGRMGHLPKPGDVIRMLELRSRPLMPLHEALFRSSASANAEELAALAADPENVRIRALLVEALGWSGNFTVVAQLEAHAHDPDFEVRCAALKAARRLEHPGACKWATTLLLDPVDVVRIQAVQTCAKLGARDAVPILSSLLGNSSWWVRTRAKEALEVLRPHQQVSTGRAAL